MRNASVRCRTAATPLMGLARLRSLICHSARGSWVHRALRHPQPVSMLRVEVRTTVRWVRTSPGSSFRAESPLQSSFALTPARPFRVELRCLGFGPPRGDTERVHFSRGHSRSSLRSARRFSQPLGGLLRASASQAYFIPQPRPGSSLVQGLLSSRSRPSSSEGSCPLAVAPHRLSRLASLTTGAALDFEALLHAKRRSSGFPSAAPLFEFLLLQVLPFFANGLGLPETNPPMKLSKTPFSALRRLSPSSIFSGVFSAKNPADSSPSC